MKKIFMISFIVLTVFSLSACSTTNEKDVTDEEMMSSEASLATLSYLSTGFLDFTQMDIDLASPLFLSNENSNQDNDETVIEGELDDVNIYIDRLKGLIENGVDNFGSTEITASDNELFEYLLTFTVSEEMYKIHYNIDPDTAEMTGIIIFGESEYDFEVMDNIHEYEYTNSNGKDDDAEEPEDDEEIEEETDENDEIKMVLIATNGEDRIKITYKNETEDDGEVTKFKVESTIDGNEKLVELKIVSEEDKYKVQITDGDDQYTFKRNVEDDGVVYRLDYEIVGTKGFVKITVTVDEEGNEVYEYFIQEAGRTKNVTKQEPKAKGNFNKDQEDDESM